jgi:adenosylhomocysteine nucleosidase
VTSLLVLTALELEAHTLARALGLDAVTGTGVPHFRGGSVEVASVGVRASELLARAPCWRPPALVVSAGVCGALSPELREGELVVPEIVISSDGERWPVDRVAGLTAAGTLYCAPAVVESPSDKARLWLETGARAVDMESAPILAWARGQAVPALVVRAVSDTSTEVVPAEFAAAVGSDGTLSATRAVRAVLARPATLSRALALRRGTAAALATVARALASLSRAALPVSDRDSRVASPSVERSGGGCRGGAALAPPDGD